VFRPRTKKIFVVPFEITSSHTRTKKIFVVPFEITSSHRICVVVFHRDYHIIIVIEYECIPFYGYAYEQWRYFEVSLCL